MKIIPILIYYINNTPFKAINIYMLQAKTKANLTQTKPMSLISVLFLVNAFPAVQSHFFQVYHYICKVLCHLTSLELG